MRLPAIIEAFLAAQSVISLKILSLHPSFICHSGSGTKLSELPLLSFLPLVGKMEGLQSLTVNSWEITKADLPRIHHLSNLQKLEVTILHRTLLRGVVESPPNITRGCNNLIGPAGTFILILGSRERVCCSRIGSLHLSWILWL